MRCEGSVTKVKHRGKRHPVGVCPVCKQIVHIDCQGRTVEHEV